MMSMHQISYLVIRKSFVLLVFSSWVWVRIIKLTLETKMAVCFTYRVISPSINVSSFQTGTNFDAQIRPICTIHSDLLFFSLS